MIHPDHDGEEVPDQMEPIKIVAAHDPEIQVPFEVPIKGRKALTFSVPKLQYLPLDVMEDFDKWLQQRTEQARNDPSIMESAKQIDETMKLLELLLPQEKYVLLDRLTLGEKLQIDTEWKRYSTMELGKSAASSTSSETAN